MTKFILVLYMCSMLTNDCPSNHIPGYTFTNHTDCVQMGYRVAHNTFMSLEEIEEFDREYVETNKIVVKFECRAVEVPKPIVPSEKPKTTT